MYHARKSILRTARLHKERDRAARRQHTPPVTWREKTSGHWKGDGYHACKCSACGTARVYWARQGIKSLMANRYWELPPELPKPTMVLLADAPDPSARRVFDALQVLAFRV